MFRRFSRPARFLLLPLLFAWVLANTACGKTSPAATPTTTASVSAADFDVSQALPATNAVPGWSSLQDKQTYDRTNLFNLVDGQAESFFVYGFEGVTVQRYQNAEKILLHLEIWRMATEDDAYGLFSAGRAGQQVAIGNEGDSDAGRRLAFWQSRFFVNLSVSQPVPDETLWSFATKISTALPKGGSQPAIVSRLPQTGLVPLSAIFFHEEMAIQMQVWLGGVNLLGLSQETNGVVARYQTAPEGGIAQLLLVEYPTAEQAAQGLKALQGGGLTDLRGSQSSGKLLGAVFGNVDSRKAAELLNAALK